MHSASRFNIKLALAPFVCVGLTLALAFAARSQDPKKESQDKPNQNGAAPSPTPKRMGTELDNTSVITNTDLITLTVTVTDSYGRYVSGLSKSAFSVLDEKQPQEITFFSDDDSPVS